MRVQLLLPNQPPSPQQNRRPSPVADLPAPAAVRSVGQDHQVVPVHDLAGALGQLRRTSTRDAAQRRGVDPAEPLGHDTTVGVAHLDGLVTRPTVWFDDRQVMRDGVLLE